jgi:uncharacterized membrane protein YhaH (DUF805 family)
MLGKIKFTIDFLSKGLGSYASLVVIILTISLATVFLLEFLLCLLSKRKKDTVYYLCYTLLNLVVTAYFAVEDYFGEKLLFETPKSVYTVMTAIVSISILFYSLICLVSRKAKKENSQLIQEENSKEVEISTIKPKTYEHYFKGNISSGYLDVSHVKSLINELKQKELSDSDYSQIEELELYLMNFISRQPDGEERAVLSEKLSMLIKKIAQYAS